jgi:4-hydroxybenzoate polyprenyltransferase
VGPFLVLARVRSCLAGGVATGIGGYLATGTVLPGPGRSLAAATGIVLTIAFAHVVNDIVDIEVDGLGQPGRPLPAGRVSAATARSFAAALAAAAVVVTVPLGPLPTSAIAALLAASLVYSVRLKNTVLLGNLVVAACASSPVPYGAGVIGRVGPAVWAATVLALEFMLSYEVLKTMADRTGDAAAGLRTVATATRTRTPRLVFLGLAATLTATAVLATAASSHPTRYLVVALPVLVVPTWYVASRLRDAVDDELLAELMRVMRRAWLVGVLALWMIR